MNFSLKKWRIDKDENAIEQINIRYNNILNLRKLQDDSLSDEEFLGIIRKMYVWDTSSISFDELIFGDVKTIYGAICLDKAVYSTVNAYRVYLYANGLSDVTEIGYNDVRKVTYPRRYSIEELEEKVRKGKLKIVSWTYGGEPEEKYCSELTSIDIRKLNELMIDKVSLDNLGAYQDILMPFIKKEFTEERITQDLKEAINQTKLELQKYQTKVEKRVSNYQTKLVNLIGELGQVKGIYNSFTKVEQARTRKIDHRNEGV